MFFNLQKFHRQTFSFYLEESIPDNRRLVAATFVRLVVVAVVDYTDFPQATKLLPMQSLNYK